MSVMKFAEEIFAWHSGKTVFRPFVTVFDGFRYIISPYPDIIDRLVPNVRGLTDGFYQSLVLLTTRIEIPQTE